MRRKRRLVRRVSRANSDEECLKRAVEVLEELLRAVAECREVDPASHVASGLEGCGHVASDIVDALTGGRGGRYSMMVGAWGYAMYLRAARESPRWVSVELGGDISYADAVRLLRRYLEEGDLEAASFMAEIAFLARMRDLGVEAAGKALEYRVRILRGECGGSAGGLRDLARRK